MITQDFIRRLVALTTSIAALCVAGLCAGSVFAADAKPVFDMPYLMKDLDNGLRVIIVPTDYPDIISLQIPVQTGSRNEVEAGKSGFAHFFEHMMFRGTDNYSPEQYQNVLKNAGAGQSAYTTDDYTNYHITFTRDDLDRILQIEADRFMNLNYSEDQFRTEALAVKGEYLKNYSNPVQKLLEVSRDRAFTTHTYKHTTMGFLRDIEDMPNQLDYSKTFFERWYRPEKAAVILVGDVDPDAAFRLVKKHFSKWREGSYSVDIPVEPPPTGPLYEHIQWDAPTQPWILLAFRGPAFTPPYRDMTAMDLLSELYFSETSALYQSLVIDQQLSDQLFSYFPNRKDPSLLYVAARLTDAGNAARVRDALFDTFALMRTTRVDAAMLRRTQSRLRYEFIAAMDNSEAIGSTLAMFVHHERTPETINAVYASYEALTPDDLSAMANRYFTDAGQILVSLSSDAAMASLTQTAGIDSRVAALGVPRPAAFKLIEQRSESSPLVDVSLLFNTGAAYDPPGKKGLAALTAAMLTDGGSARRSSNEINDAMYPMAASFGRQVDKEMTRLSGTVHRDNLDHWLALAMEQLLEPGWRDEDLSRLKTQQTNAIRTDLVGNNDEELAKELLYARIYGDSHPYGSHNLGASEDIANISMDDIRDFYAGHYAAENLTLGLAGGYPPALVDKLRRMLGALPAGKGNSLAVPAARLRKGRTAVIVEKQTPGVAVSFGIPIDVRRGDPDWVALWLARSWLGEHRKPNAHLFQRIRELRGMNYGDYAYIEYFPGGMFQFQPNANLGRQQQIFQVWVRPLRSNNDAHFATRIALFELDKLRRDGMSVEAFAASRNFLNKYVALLTATQSRQLGYALDSEYYGTAPFARYVRDALSRMTLGDVNRAIRRHLDLADATFVFVTSDAADLAKRLGANLASPIEYPSPKPELAEEDATIATYSLGIERASIEVVLDSELFK